MSENNENSSKKTPVVKGKCICQICTCGRHRCPHNRGTLGTSPVLTECALRTEYQQAYEKWANQRRRDAFCPQPHKHINAVPMNTETTYTHNYIKLRPQACIVKPVREYAVPTVRMEKDSTYTNSYVPKDGQRSESFKPNKAWQRSSATFYKDTMYNDYYKNFGADLISRHRAKPMKHKECIIVDSDPMDALSVMKDDFRPHEKPERAQMVRPVSENMSGVRGRFDPATTYTAEYTEKEGAAVKKAVSPDTYVPNPAPFEGETTVMADYQPHPNAKRVQSQKPSRNFVPLATKFDHITTVADAYKPWPIKREGKPLWALRKPIDNGTDPFSKTSSYQEDYTQPLAHERTKLANPGRDPPLRLHHDSSDQPAFSKHTQYREMYNKAYGFHKPKSFKINNDYELPKEPIETKSVYQSQYQGKFSMPASICIPVSNSKNSPSRAILFNTTYNDTFQGECPLVCPAKVIIDSKPDGKDGIKVEPYGEFHKDQLHNGHHFYMVKGPPVNAEVFRDFDARDINEAMTESAIKCHASKPAHQELVLA